MSKWTIAALCALIILTVGCTGGGTGTAPTVPAGSTRPTVIRTITPTPANDEEAIRQLINAECEAVVQQDIDRLQGLWSSDGVVTDAQHTPDNTTDDSTWKGWDAIRDRYLSIVFPSNPTFCEHPDVQVTVSPDKQSATAISGVNICVTKASNSNKWTFKKTGEGWRITALTYNLDAQK